MRTELVTDALQMAIAHRRPEAGLIWQSDLGGQTLIAPSSGVHSEFAVRLSRSS